MIVVLGVIAAIANRFDKGEDTIEQGHDCSTCTAAKDESCKLHCLLEEKGKLKKIKGDKGQIAGIFIIILLSFSILSSCNMKKNTATNRMYHAFTARYNIYFNGQQAFIDGNLEKEKGNKDNFTEMIPLYMVGNKQSRELGKGQYDRAIEKSEKAIRLHSVKGKPVWKSNKKKSAKDREWLGRKEYNPFIWKAWMLLGKAQFQKGAFDEAAATFSYMTRLYQTQPVQSGLAKAWLAKCYTELGWLYDAEDVIRNMSRDSMDFRTVNDWDYTYADYYIRTGDYEKAVPYLRKAIKHERRKAQKAREWFLMGQIQNLLGNREAAYQAYQKVVGCHPPYETEFNARIAQTEVMAANDGGKMISRLKRMAKSDNNKEYLDQVYYALGNIYLNQGDTLQAIGAYEKGNKESVRNGVEKGVLLLTLGNLYWEMERFGDAHRCYGEAIGLLDRDRKDYEELSFRSKVLDELVPHTEAIHLQDSLLELSVMPEAERLAAIDRVIEALKQKEKEEREAQLDAEAEELQQEMQKQQGANPNQPNTPTTPTLPTTQGNGQWYFYNPMAVSQGKTTFQQQWGRRENKDNWQRINVTVVRNEPEESEDSEDSENAENAEASDSLQAGGLPEDPSLSMGRDSISSEEKPTGTDSLANDPHEREYYLAQIPFTEEQKAGCHAIIQDALFHAGVIFKDKLENLPLSERHLRRLTDNYDDYEYLDEAWYHLFLLYSRWRDFDMADACLDKMTQKYPDSEWTILLTDPYYEENARFGEHIEDSLYTATYDAFKNDRYEMVNANAKLSEQRFPQGEHRDKFLFIEGLSLLNEGYGDSCIVRLKEVVERFPDSEVSEMAGMIIKGVNDGRRLHGGKFDIGDVWSRRDITLSADSTRQDTLDARTDLNFVFILAYQPDSVDVNENQLLYNMARYNFTNFLVRNFDIQIDDDHGLRRMLISGFLSYDEALQYARQLYADETMSEQVKDCRSLIISETNLPLLGTAFSYDDYMKFYEDKFIPLKISEEELLIVPEGMTPLDPEDIGDDEEGSQESGAGSQETDDEDDLFPMQKPQPKVQDFDFGDDFW
jgi:tetratricopeptide (TPR) repeat protein